SLVSLLRDVKEEAVSILLMRGNDAEAMVLAGVLGVPYEELLAQSFGRVIAYSIAYDLSRPRVGEERSTSNEIRIRKTLGKDAFVGLMTSHFVNIVTVLFLSLDQEENVERALSKSSSFEYALETMREIQSISFSDS